MCHNKVLILRNQQKEEEVWVYFEADRKVMAVLRALRIEIEVVQPANGNVGWARFAMTEDLDELFVDLLDRLIDIRLAYIDGRQRQHGMQLPLPEEAGGGV